MVPNFTTYSIERLSQEYKETDLQPKKSELITDEEVSIFLNEHYWLWKAAPFIVIAFVILFLSWMGTP